MGAQSCCNAGSPREPPLTKYLKVYNKYIFYFRKTELDTVACTVGSCGFKKGELFHNGRDTYRTENCTEAGGVRPPGG